MAKRIPVPDNAVRTREQILANSSVYVSKSFVWKPCWNCGGSGNYPSAMTPPGRCRLMCWAGRHTNAIAQALGALPPAKSPDDPTYGRLAVEIDKYVKREQADDRAGYRAMIKEREEAPARLRAERAAQEERDRRDQAEREEFARREADENERKTISRHVGAVGDRVDTTATLVDRRSCDSQFGRRSIYRFRDSDGNVLVWFTGSALPVDVGGSVTIRASVKEHGEYQGERQTVTQRVKVVGEPAGVTV